MAENDQDKESKTEEATPKRRGELRAKGNVAKSQDLTSAVLLTGGFLLLAAFGGRVFGALMDFMLIMIGKMEIRDLKQEDVVSIFNLAWDKVLPSMSTVILSFAAIGLAINYYQVGFKFTPEKIRLNLGKLNPIPGIKNLINIKALVRALASVAKTTVIVLSIYFMVASEVKMLALLDRTNLDVILPFLGMLVFKTCMGAGGALIVIGIIDFIYQKWQFARDIRMTKQEVKDEHKQTEGDPKVKAAIRKKMQQTAYAHMLEEVPKATVVVTNPTHFAVALKYTQTEDMAPKVVAKGRDLIAQTIKDIAKEHDVPIVENKPLAQSLYRTAEVGMEIPANLYRAVAELLSYVFKLRGKL